MMSRFALSLLIAALLLAASVFPGAAESRDPLAPVFDMEAEPLQVHPPELVAEDNQEAIVGLVHEARQFGAPIAVRVVSLEGGHEFLPDLGGLQPGTRIAEDSMRELANAWMDREPIESSPGADDGFLMLVIIPEDQARSSAIIEPAPDALPLNGLTRENLEDVLATHVLPSFENNEVSQGIRTGLSLFSYNNLFGKPDRIELGDLHQDLQMVAGIPLAGATALGAVALAGLALWIRSREPGSSSADAAQPISAFAAASLHQGRVDDAVVTGALLELVRHGALVEEGDRLRIDERRAPETSDPLLSGIVATLRRNAGADGVIQPAAARRLHDLMSPAVSALEDELATRGLFNKDGRVELMWLALASGLVGAIALFTLIPSILGMARFGIASITLAAVTIVVVLTWAARRSWTTRQGREALKGWREAASAEDRFAFDSVVHQDELVSAIGGPFTPPTVNLVRRLRGLGPA
jgi:hypothetical protein